MDNYTTVMRLPIHLKRSTVSPKNSICTYELAQWQGTQPIKSVVHPCVIWPAATDLVKHRSYILVVGLHAFGIDDVKM